MSTTAVTWSTATRPDLDDLDVLVEQIVDTFPPLTDERKRALGQLLSPAHNKRAGS